MNSKELKCIKAKLIREGGGGLVVNSTLTASSSRFPVLFFPEDLDEGEGEGDGADRVSSCSISFSSFIRPGGSTPYLSKA